MQFTFYHAPWFMPSLISSSVPCTCHLCSEYIGRLLWSAWVPHYCCCGCQQVYGTSRLCYCSQFSSSQFCHSGHGLTGICKTVAVTGSGSHPTWTWITLYTPAHSFFLSLGFLLGFSGHPHTCPDSVGSGLPFPLPIMHCLHPIGHWILLCLYDNILLVVDKHLHLFLTSLQTGHHGLQFILLIYLPNYSFPFWTLAHHSFLECFHCLLVLLVAL